MTELEVWGEYEDTFYLKTDKFKSKEDAINYIINGGFNISNFMLDEVDVTKLNIAGSDFSGARLFGKDLTFLQGVDLSGTKFIDASLAGANLNGLNLNGVDLTKACIRYTKFKNTIFKGAIVKGTILESFVFCQDWTIHSYCLNERGRIREEYWDEYSYDRNNNFSIKERMKNGRL